MPATDFSAKIISGKVCSLEARVQADRWAAHKVWSELAEAQSLGAQALHMLEPEVSMSGWAQALVSVRPPEAQYKLGSHIHKGARKPRIHFVRHKPLVRHTRRNFQSCFHNMIHSVWTLRIFRTRTNRPAK